MLANDGIVFFDLHFFRHGFFVFSGGVEMASAFARNQFDFVTHILIPLNFFAAATDIRQHSIDAVLVDYTHTF